MNNVCLVKTRVIYWLRVNARCALMSMGDCLSYSYRFSFCFLHARLYIKVSGRTKPAFVVYLSHLLQIVASKVCLPNHSSIFLKNRFPVQVIPVFDHSKAYIYSIFSCEGQDFLHWGSSMLALIFVFLHLRD